MKYTTAEKNQIAKRFDAMYRLLTKKSWIKGREAEDSDGEEVKPTSKHAERFCLIGAVRHINGPTEEEIAKLIAYQILIDTEQLNDVLIDEGSSTSIDFDITDPLHRVRAIGEFFGGSFDYSDTIVEWNDADDRTIEEVRSMLKRATKLYEKLMPVGSILQQLSAAEEAAAKLKV